MTDILQAARSYYGMEGTPVGKCEMYTNEHGSMRLVIEIPVTGSDFIAIGQRMKAMQEAESHEQADTTIAEGPTVEAMREAYNALSKAEKGRYGSFARYMAESSAGIIDAYTGEPYEKLLKREEVSQPSGNLPDKRVFEDIEWKARQVVHVDAPEEPERVSMDAVWIHGEDATHAQTMFPVDYNALTNEYLIQWAMLTDEQKQKAKESKQ